MAATRGTNVANSGTAGSWHRSGYHGHSRSKSRLDFINEFRQLAKPPPPDKFMRLSQQRPTVHPFSIHDNRNSFMNDALYFEQGLGRKRAPGKNMFAPEFLSWMPHRYDYDKPGPKSTVYLTDFKHGGLSESYLRKIVDKPKTSFDPTMPKTTTYRYAHGRDNPNKNILNAMSNMQFRSSTGKPTGITKKGGARESVASCMVWHPAPNRLHHYTSTMASSLHENNNNSGLQLPKTAPASISHQTGGMDTEDSHRLPPMDSDTTHIPTEAGDVHCE